MQTQPVDKEEATSSLHRNKFPTGERRALVPLEAGEGTGSLASRCPEGATWGHFPERGGNAFFLSTKGPEKQPVPLSVQVLPGIRTEVERPPQPAAQGPHVLLWQHPLHCWESPEAETRHCSQPVLTAHFCPVFKGPLYPPFPFSLCPSIASGEFSYAYCMKWGPQAGPLQAANWKPCQKWEEEAEGGKQPPLAGPPCTANSNAPAQRVGLFPSQPHRSPSSQLRAPGDSCSGRCWLTI